MLSEVAATFVCTDFLETWHELSCFSSNQQIEFVKQNTVTKKNLTNHNGGFHPKYLFQEHGRRVSLNTGFCCENLKRAKRQESPAIAQVFSSSRGLILQKQSRLMIFLLHFARMFSGIQCNKLH